MIERIKELEKKLAKSEEHKRRDNTNEDYSFLDEDNEEDKGFNETSESSFKSDQEDNNKLYKEMKTWEEITVMVPVDASSSSDDSVVSLSLFKVSEI